MEEINQWRQAGKIAANSLQLAKSLIKKGNTLLEAADKVDDYIKKQGAKPAWPTQINLNSVAAHATPDPDEDTVFNDEVICVDVGAHLNYCVGDNAASIDLSGKYADLVKCTREALNNAIKTCGIGVRVGEIGKAIQETIESYGYKPVSNLCGHTITTKEIHASPTIPNVKSNSQEALKDGQIIAIEPFATDGAGRIAEADFSNLFAIGNKKPVRSPYAREILNYCIKEYNHLPFTTRWISKQFGLGKTNLGLKELMNAGILRSYPPLVEIGGGKVAQSEHTILIRDKVEVLTIPDEE